MPGAIQLLKLYGLTAVVFFAADLVWLGVVAQGFYQKQLGHLLRPDVVWPADLTCLALFAGFPVIVVVVDLIWGLVLTAGVSAAGFGLGRWLGMG